MRAKNNHVLRLVEERIGIILTELAGLQLAVSRIKFGWTIRSPAPNLPQEPLAWAVSFLLILAWVALQVWDRERASGKPFSGNT